MPPVTSILPQIAQTVPVAQIAPAPKAQVPPASEWKMGGFLDGSVLDPHLDPMDITRCALCGGSVELFESCCSKCFPNGLGTLDAPNQPVAAPAAPSIDDTFALIALAAREACALKLRCTRVPWGCCKAAVMHQVPAEFTKVHLMHWDKLLKAGRIHLIHKGYEGSFYLPDFLLTDDCIDRAKVEAFVIPTRFALIVPSFGTFHRIYDAEHGRQAVVFTSKELALRWKGIFAKDLLGANVEARQVTGEVIEAWKAEGRCTSTLVITESNIARYAALAGGELQA